MASGDASRTWFPEMVEFLKKEWHESFSSKDFINLCDELDSMLQRIRAERNIKPPMMWCSHCKERHRSKPSRVSVRATILSLFRFKIANEDKVKQMEKDWKKYRAKNDLDLYGKPVSNETNEHHHAIIIK